MVTRDPETEDTVISGMGELHLDIILDRVKREFNVGVTCGTPQVAYREAITATAEVNERFAKQTGGHGQFAQVRFTVEPLGAGQGFEFVDKIRSGAIPKEYIPAIERGIIGVMAKGIWAGYPIVDLRVTLIHGKHHEVDSSKRAFFTCAGRAFKKAFARAGPELLEPVMGVNVTTPEQFAGPVIGNLCSRRGRVTGTEARGTAQIVSAMVPLATMLGYATDLRGMTQGRANFTMQFERYEPVPFAISEEVIEKRRRASGGA